IRRVIQQLGDGIAPERLLFSINTSHQDHMLAYQQCDICLDSLPHGGGVVSQEQLYMGDPIITLYGPQAAGRTASSVLTAMGRKDWIAKTAEEYVEKAVKLANNTAELNKVRKSLREELLNSPVVKGYREATESVYRQMWQAWCNG